MDFKRDNVKPNVCKLFPRNENRLIPLHLRRRVPFFGTVTPTNSWKMKFGKSICILNVGGTKYAFSKDVIKDFPLSRVSRLHKCASEKEVLEVCDDYDRERNEFFFDRHSEAFGFIMLYVKYGKLRFVPQMCELSFYNEMIYWGLESSHLEFCCQRRLDDRMSDTYTHFSEEDTIKHEGGLRGDCLENREGADSEQSKWLERMRRTFEEPTSSVAAQILASVSVIFVIVSMVMLCASTLPDWKSAESSVEEQRYTDSLEHPSGYLCPTLLSSYFFLFHVIHVDGLSAMMLGRLTTIAYAMCFLLYPLFSNDRDNVGHVSYSFYLLVSIKLPKTSTRLLDDDVLRILMRKTIVNVLIV